MTKEAGITAEDALSALMENTRNGSHSRIGYVKANGQSTERVIEPMRLVEASAGTLVQAVQIDPKTTSPFRSFRLDRITSVTGDHRPISPSRLETNNFVTGEIHEVRANRRRSRSRTGDTPAPPSTPFSRAHGEWLLEYVPLVRVALLDLRISSEERSCVMDAQRALGLGPAEVAAAHALIFAEDSMACALDGRVTDAECEYLTHLNTCLGELGWAPVSV